MEVVEQGFGAVKFDVDHTGTGKLDPYNWTVGAKEMTHVIELIESIRNAIGYEVDLAIDCHGQFDLPSAITLAKAVEPLRLMWLEEPVPAENIDALAQVRASIQHRDLQRREPVYALRVYGVVRAKSRRCDYARPGQSRWHRRRQANRRYG